MFHTNLPPTNLSQLGNIPIGLLADISGLGFPSRVLGPGNLRDLWVLAISQCAGKPIGRPNQMAIHSTVPARKVGADDERKQ
jgi:hypothetical protein